MTQVDGSHKSAARVCMEQNFNPAFGFEADWGFSTGTVASSILDFGRLHIDSVSMKKQLDVVFMDLQHEGSFWCCTEIVKPDWYPFKGRLAKVLQTQALLPQPHASCS